MKKILCLVFLIGISPLLRAQDRPITNDEIIQLLKAGVSEEVITEKIAVSGCRCDTSAFGIMILRSAGASDTLIRTIINASAPTRPTTQSQVPPAAQEETKATLFGGYSYLRSEGSLGDVNWHGFNVAFAGHVNDWLALAADVSGHYTDLPDYGVDGSLYNVAFGPQFGNRKGRVRGFSHFLVGFGRVSADFLDLLGFSQTELSTVIGGGIDVGVSEHLGIRVFQGDWIRLWSDDGGDFGRISVGLVGFF